jgi:adenylate cyclase
VAVPTSRDLPVSFERLAARTTLRLAVANLAGAVTVFVYLALIQGNAEGLAFSPRDTRISVIVFVIFMAAVAPLLVYTGNRTFAPVARWLREDRPPTPEEQQIVLSQPLRHAAVAFVFWIAAAMLFGVVLQVWLGHSAEQMVNVTLGVLLGGVVTTRLTFLLVERSLRPLFAFALQAGLPRRTASLGITTRLVLSWALGSGVPLLGIALLPLGRTARGRQHLAVPAVFLAAAGLVSGLVMLTFAARSVAERLAEVRTALGKVQDGDLSVAVTVDDGGDIGLLQTGVNRMVEGLRQREQLQDLFGRHVGEAVARLALDRGTGLTGEERQASVLFVDIIGSTVLAGTVSPQHMVRVLNAFFAAVVPTVGAEGGWVNKFEGDAALCVFGAPGDQSDHAARALRSARALRAALLTIAVEYPGLDAASGVSSGRVVAGNVGTEQRYEYTVIGDAVNEASRLTDLAKDEPGRVLASERAVKAVGPPEFDHWTAAFEVTLRGRSEPTCVYRPKVGKGTAPCGDTPGGQDEPARLAAEPSGSAG